MLAIAFSATSALALEKMDSKSKSDVTAQSGVTISFEGVTANTTVASVAYGDDDGIGGTTTAGWIILDGNIVASTAVTGSLTIDAATAGAAGHQITGANGPLIAANTSFVKLGLPNVATTVSATEFDLVLGSAANTTAASGNTLGTINVGNITAGINGGSVYIYPH